MALFMTALNYPGHREEAPQKKMWLRLQCNSFWGYLATPYAAKTHASQTGAAAQTLSSRG